MGLTIITKEAQWDAVIETFPRHDIYYRYAYVHSLELHGDGTPMLFLYETEKGAVCYVALKEDIALFPAFRGHLAEGTQFDLSTPYGYGGPLTRGNCSEELIADFVKELTSYCCEHKIVSQFFRFHPLLGNHTIFEKHATILTSKQTIYMDTSSEEIIFQNMTSKNRNMVRKAEKNGITIMMDSGEHMDEFIKIYEETMDKNHAEDYYYFDRNYFSYLFEHLKGHICVFYAIYESKIISASIFLYDNVFMHYHLSGTLNAYRNLGANNLILYEGAKFASAHHLTSFHLGGGIENEDALFSFKKHFNRNGRLDFYIGRMIFDEKAFDSLVNLRKKTDINFDVEKPFLIKYRG